MNVYRRKLILKRLGSVNLTLVVFLNIILPFAACMAGQLILNYQIRYYDSIKFTASYSIRMQILSLLLSMVILGTIDYIFIIYPVIRLEHIVEQYCKLAKMENKVAYDCYFTRSSLEKMFMDMLNEQKQRLKHDEEAENKRQETELYALQTQINPHFLYNTLDSIRGLALLNGVDEIASMTEALSRLFRNMIAKEGKLLTLREEFENVNSYILIQEFRFNNRFDYRLEIEEKMLDRYLVPNLILQPVVENAIMHGLEKKTGKGTIIIAGYSTEKRLVIEVTDNGVGMDGEKLESLNKKLKARETNKWDGYKGGIALLNINQRIKLRYGDIYGIYMSSTPDVITTVQIVLPLICAGQEKDFAYE